MCCYIECRYGRVFNNCYAWKIVIRNGLAILFSHNSVMKWIVVYRVKRPTSVYNVFEMFRRHFYEANRWQCRMRLMDNP